MYLVFISIKVISHNFEIIITMLQRQKIQTLRKEIIRMALWSEKRAVGRPALPLPTPSRYSSSSQWRLVRGSPTTG